jgi:alkylation response protein AidB-like acyl-CoA dehydrogenase
MAALFDPEAFRAEVRDFCARALPPDLRAKAEANVYFTKEDRVRWQRLLQARGWFAAHWPSAHGGADWGQLQRFILIEELEYAGTPWLTHFGISFAGPLLCAFGTQAQRAAHLPGILNSTVWWCQGFSEPGAGSDLASVQTGAVLDGDEYVVTGQKTWTTMAQWADMMFALVRTDREAGRHEGLSLILIDLTSPGVTIRPIATIDGLRHVNEVFLDDVRVPCGNLVASEGDGWRCTRFIVGMERPLVTELGKARRLYDALLALGYGPGSFDAAFRYQVAELGVRLEALRALAYAAAARAHDGPHADTDASMLKIRGSELQQALLGAILEAGARDGLLAPAEGGEEGYRPAAGLVADHLHARATSIYGGSNEIQANIIARAVLPV